MVTHQWQNNYFSTNIVNGAQSNITSALKIFDQYNLYIPKLISSIKVVLSDLNNYFAIYDPIDTLSQYTNQYNQYNQYISFANTKLDGFFNNINVTQSPSVVITNSQTTVLQWVIGNYQNITNNNTVPSSDILPNLFIAMQDQGVMVPLETIYNMTIAKFNSPQNFLDIMNNSTGYSNNITQFFWQYDNLLNITSKISGSTLSNAGLAKDIYYKMISFFGNFSWSNSFGQVQLKASSLPLTPVTADKGFLATLMTNNSQIAPSDQIVNFQDSEFYDRMYFSYKYYLNAIISTSKAKCFAEVNVKQSAATFCYLEQPVVVIGDLSKQTCENIRQKANIAFNSCSYIFPMQTDQDNIIQTSLDSTGIIQVGLNSNGLSFSASAGNNIFQTVSDYYNNYQQPAVEVIGEVS